MDYRLPGLDGVQATRGGARGVPGRRGRLPDRVGERCARSRRCYEAGAVACLTQGRGARRDRRGDPRRRAAAGGVMKLTAENTAIVARLDRRLPRGAASASRTGASCRSTCASATRASATTSSSTPDEFYERLRTAPELPTTSQPTPGDFLAAYEELGGYERILSLHIAGEALGDVRERRARRPQRARRRPRARDRLARRASAAIAMLGARDPAAARARHDRRGDRRARRALPRARHGLLFTVDTLEYLARGGRIGRARALRRASC